MFFSAAARCGPAGHAATQPVSAPAKPRAQRGIQWAVGAVGLGGPADPAPFLLGSNPHRWGNTSLSVSDITTGVLQCCSGLVINITDHLLEAYPSQTWLHQYDAYAAASMAAYIDIDPAEGEHERANATVGEPGGPAIGLNCSNPPTAAEMKKGCITPADICSAALARKEAFADEVLAFVLSRNVTGVSVDWEYAYGNNQTCFAALWAHVAAVLAPHGREFAPWISNGGGWSSTRGDADAEWDYQSYLPFASKLINMGSYEAYGEAYPNKNRSLVPVPCVDVPGGDPATVNPVGRYCGLEGTIVDFLKRGARLDQILPALEMTECCGGFHAQNCTGPDGYGHDGVMTTAGWTQPVLRAFLKYIAASNISTVAIWTNGAMSAGPNAPTWGDPGLATCPWFIEELRAFVLGEKKGPCTEFFGADVDSNSTTGTLWTVADVDVHAGFPFGNETFIHHAGPHSVCYAPGPPAGYHRYYVAQYDAGKCDARDCPLVNGKAAALAGTLDTTGAFDRAAGVLKGCFGCVKSVKVSCWGAPAGAPVACACPGTSNQISAPPAPTKTDDEQLAPNSTPTATFAVPVLVERSDSAAVPNRRLGKPNSNVHTTAACQPVRPRPKSSKLPVSH